MPGRPHPAAAACLRAVLETAFDGVFLIDARGTVLMFNPACERLFKYDATEVIGNNVKLLMPEPYDAELDRDIRRFASREVVGRRKGGTTFPMELAVGEAEQDGESLFVGVVRDLTERKRTEQQLVQAQKMETVGQLSGGIAHDFNNLLTVIVGNAEFLGDQLKDRADLRHLADDIGRAGERGSELTQRLLAFGRHHTLRPVEIDCNGLFESMQKLLRRTLRANIEIRTNFEPGLRPAYADAAQLESAILNLSLNAQDAMASGGRLSVTTANVSLDGHYHSLHPEVRPGEYVLIAITDDGEGMPKSILDRVFEPFFTTKEVGKGSGLGLSMVYGFIKQSNGHVSVYSEPGLGTTVRMYLPAVLDAVLDLPPPLRADSDETHGGKEAILVVEDDPFVRSHAIRSLESLGYRVTAAVDGNDALQKLGTDISVDVLFTDIVMPGGFNGWALAERARQDRPDLRVLLTSGYALETLAAHEHLRDCSAILTKPYRKVELARRLREVLTVKSAL